MTTYKTSNPIGVGDLDSFLIKWETKDFLLGTNDCVHFINDYLTICKGVTLDIPNYTTTIGAKRAYKNLKTVDVFDKYFTRVVFPSVGDIVMRPEPKDTITGQVLGICIGSKAGYLGMNGLVFYKLEPELETYWKP